MDLTKLNRDELRELQDAVAAEFKDRNAKGDFGMAEALVDDTTGGDPLDVYRNLSPADLLFKVKDRVNKENRARLKAAADEKAKDPKAFAEKVKAIVDRIMPAPGSVDVKVPSNVKEFQLTDFPDNAMLAHVMKKAGLFPSVGQAKKNGWDKPIEKGSWTVGKNKTKVVIK